jgi:hypothetical protein
VRYSIPEPVTGGFAAALAFCALHAFSLVDIGFDMTTRDKLLVILFATVGVTDGSDRWRAAALSAQARRHEAVQTESTRPGASTRPPDLHAMA